jgi:hypothetical protein
MILMNSRKIKTCANGLRSSFASKKALVAALCMAFVAAAALESAAQQYVVRITPSVGLQQAMADGGVPVSAANLTVEGGPIKATDFEYVRTRMAGTLQTLDMSAATAENNAVPSLALENCAALSSVRIPNTATAIHFGAFLHCSALVSAEIPAGVTSIGGGAFRDCGVSSITCYAPVPPALFDALFDNPYGITLSVPYGTKTLYENAYLWKECGIITELPASTDASLKRIDASAGTLSPPFDPSTANYTLSVPNTVTSISVAGIPNHYRATVVGNVIDKPLAPGNNEIAITVTAEDGTTKRTYRIAATRAHSTDATLKSIALSVAEVSLVPPFDPGITDYAAEVENEITGISVTATAAHSGASVNGGGNSTSINKSLAVGPNTTDITVTAEDGSTQKTYRIVFNRLLSSDASLKNLTADKGVIEPAFHAATTDYTVKVPFAVTDITLVAEVNNPGASAGGDGYKTLNPGANVFPIVVTAEDGTQRTYTLVAVRQSDDAELANLTVGAGTLVPAFIPSATDYTVNVGSETADLAVVGTPRHPGASVAVTGGSSLVTGTNTVEIAVTSEDATVTMVYRITVVRAPSSDTRLLNILVSTGTIAFDPAATSFTAHAGTATRIDVTGIANHPNAMVLGNVAGKSLSRGDNFVTITVVAEDGSTAEYPVRIIRAPSSDASLSDIVLSPGLSPELSPIALVPSFAPGQYDYTVNVPNSVTRISVAGIRNHDSATLTGNLTDKEIWVKGANVARIAVTAEDGAVTTVYTVRIVRAPSSDARLKDIAVDVGALSPAFDAAVSDYTVSVGNGTTSVAVVGTPEHDSATVVTAGGSSLAVGNNPVTVTVTAEDGITAQSYIVTVVRAKSSDASLQNIRAEAPVAGTLAVYPPFDPDVTDYTVAVANAVTSITVAGEKRHYASTVTGNVADRAIVVGDNLVPLTVTAEDGTVRVYSLTVVRMSDDADLSALTASAGTLSPAFVPGTTDYTVDVPNDTTEITVWGTASHAKATVAGNGRYSLAVGANPIDVTVTAEDPSATKVYTVTAVRAPSSDALLQDIQISAGSLSFIDGVTDYAVTVANSVDAVTLTGIRRHPGASVSGDGIVALAAGDNAVNITVTAEDGTTVRTYRVTVHRLSNDASLSALAASEGALTPAFDAAVTDYSVTVANAVTSINIAGIARHPSASVAGNVSNKTLPTGVTAVNITVTAEDGTTRTYKVAVRRLSNDATLSSLTASAGSISPTFNPATKDYTTTVANSVTSISVTGIANHPGAGVSGNVANKSLTAGANAVSIVVTAEDGTSLTYKLIVHRLSNDASLSSLAVSRGTLVPAFDPAVKNYTVTAGSEVTSIGVTGNANHPAATVTGNVADKPLPVGATAVNLTVTAEDGTTDTYRVTVRRLSNDATLGSLAVSGGNISPAFNPNVTEYGVTLASGTTRVSVTGIASHAGAAVAGNVTDKTVAVGVTPIEVTVTAENGNTKTYRISITRLSDDAALQNIQVSAGTLAPAFNAAVTEYVLNIGAETASVTISGVANHAAASVSGNVTDKILPVGSTIVNIVVTAEDGATKKTYSVTAVRPSDDATLSAISLSAGTLSPAFNPQVKDYTVKVSSNVTSIAVAGTTNHASATVAGNTGDKALAVGATVIELTVTAQDGATTALYRVTALRAASNDATLSGLTVSAGTLLFDVASTDYTVKVGNKVESISVTGVASHPGAAVEGNVADKILPVGATVVNITVTAEDGTTAKVYKVTAVRAASDDAALKDIQLSAGTLVPAFSPDATSYTVSAGNEVTNISVTGAANHPAATVSGNVTNKALDEGYNAVSINVTAEDGKTSKTYLVTVLRAASNDATLKNISVTPGALTPSFSPHVSDYTVNVANTVTSISVTAAANHASATVAGAAGNKPLNVGANVTALTVTAGDGTSRTYTVTVIRADECSLLDITLNGNPARIEGAVAHYLASCGETVVRIDNIRVSAGAVPEINGGAYDGGDIRLTGNLTSVSIRVKSGNTVQDYTLKIAAALDGGKLYVRRWDNVISINRNPATNGGYEISDVTWYRKGAQTGKGDYVKLDGASASEYYAEVKVVEGNGEVKVNEEWHRICHAADTRSVSRPVAYPNPVGRGESLMLRLPDRYVGGTLSVYSLSGAAVKTGVPLFSETSSVDVSDLASGIYILRVVAATGETDDVKIIVAN